jgi:adenosyl cobinamide kinase/adenosyl cobinamide phosphate guanylyltransferase
VPTGGVALLEDLGNLVSNALFAPDGSMADADEVLSRLENEVMGLADRFDHVVIVGNEVGCEGPSPYEATRIWVRLTGSLACRLAARCDTVAEVVCGCPQVLKGRLP